MPTLKQLGIHETEVEIATCHFLEMFPFEAKFFAVQPLGVSHRIADVGTVGESVNLYPYRIGFLDAHGVHITAVLECPTEEFLAGFLLKLLSAHNIVKVVVLQCSFEFTQSSMNCPTAIMPDADE